MKTKLVFFSSFNRTLFPQVHKDKSRPHPCLHRDWIEKRFEIWNRYTRMSIANQAVEDHIYVVCCYPDARQITDEVFADVIKADTRLRLSYSWSDQGKQVMREIARGCDEIMLVRVDSDDMYHPKASKGLMDAPRREWYYWRKGYAYVYQPGKRDGGKQEDGKMYRYDTQGVGPFFAHRMLPADFLRLDAIRQRNHKSIRKHNPAVLPRGMFLVGITNQNTSTRIKSKTVKGKMYNPQKQQVLEEYGIREER